MGQESLGNSDINSRSGEEKCGSFLSTGGVASLEPLEIFQGVPGEEESSGLAHLLEMTNCQLKDVSLLQLGHIFTLSL